MLSRRFIIISILFIILVGGTVAVLADVTTPMVRTHSTVFEVMSGDSVWNIAHRLSEQQIIRSPLWFVVRALFSGHFSAFKPGVYEITSTSLSDISRALSLGPQEIRITIVPGMTLREIDALFSERGIIPAGLLQTIMPTLLRSSCSPCTYATNLEGLLAPDTYQFYRGSNPETVVRTLIEVSEKNLRLATDNKSITDRDLYEKIIVASLLEKEVQSYTDKQLVAGIIYKRLSLHMRLQIDASVSYGACLSDMGKCVLTRDSFKVDTPFNTYTREGLPPNPIASPSLDSLRAAFYPQTSLYLYYLSDPLTGTTYFSKTFDEHDTKRGIYLR